jgi:hypothetical protein
VRRRASRYVNAGLHGGDMKTKTVLIGDGELSARDIEFIDEAVADALRDMGIEVTSFAWHIEVEIPEELT